MGRQQHGMVVWLTLSLLITASVLLLPIRGVQPPMSQIQSLNTQTALSLAHQALLAYAHQALGLTACETNCPRPGDLPCPDRNLDGVAETSCSQSNQRLGRLPWKTLGVGELRDGSGELLWYAVSNAYKNNPRILPLHLDTPGSWNVRYQHGPQYDIAVGTGAVAVIIAPNAPLIREDGLMQTRNTDQRQQPQHYLEVAEGVDNGLAVELAANGFIAAAASPRFNDELRVVTAQQMHTSMQRQVVSILKSLFACSPPCASLAESASVEDASCLGHGHLVGACLSNTAILEALGRIPVTSAGRGPIAGTSVLDASAQHHWFQQNGWREQVFYRVRGQQLHLVVAGEAQAGQVRATTTHKQSLVNYLEASTLAHMGIASVGASPLPSNDLWLVLQR